jgi:hypothetical protein
LQAEDNLKMIGKLQFCNLHKAAIKVVLKRHLSAGFQQKRRIGRESAQLGLAQVIR